MGVEQVLAVARVVSRDAGARLLTESNVAGPRVGLEEAARSGKAFFVTPRPDLLVVDVDVPTVGAWEPVLAAADRLVDAARRVGVPHAVVPSGRPGHSHIYLVIPPGQGRARLARWCADHGLDVRTSGVRPPGAPHRVAGIPPAGGAEMDAQWLAQVARTLSQPGDAGVASRLADQVCPVRLPGRVRTALTYGHARAGYASPSHARMALAVAVRARGGTVGLVAALLGDRSSPLGETFRARDGRWQSAELLRLWDKAGVWLASGARGDGAARVWQVAAAADRFGWRGQAGGSDLAVLEALLRVAERVGSPQVGAALGDVAVGAGVSVDTARAAIRRLVRSGWLRVVASETPRTSRVYELAVPEDVDGEVASAGGPVVVPPGQFGDLGADEARRAGLGKMTVRVGRELVRAGAGQVRQVADRLGMSVASVRYHLRKLARARLASREGRWWQVRADAVAVAAVRERLGVAGIGASQALLLAQRRQQRALALERARAAFARLRPHRAPPLAD